MLDAAPALCGLSDLSIVHLGGEEDRARVAARYAAAGIAAEVHGFYADMPGLYARIDLAVTRAGATTVAELCAAGIPALYVPLPWAAEDHQTANAQAVARVGGAVVLPQAGTSPQAVAGWNVRFARERDLLARMGEAAHTLARPQAARAVALLVQGLAPVARRAQHAERRARQRLRAARCAVRGWRAGAGRAWQREQP